ncbi:MAG TPA: RES family NAD+ phosphorylase [Polyangiaceae bacterium]|nr:RES family NAD+ phosphorylase [Polyangiaceae bacterium]
MSGHPAPPTTFPLVVTRVSWTWWRIHSREHDPLHFGRETLHRFDAPAGEFGVSYVAKDVHGAFIETFGHATGVRFVTEREIAARGLARITTSRPLRLADLRAEGLARMGADAALTSGPDYAMARRWARAIHAHPRGADGILYRARHDPARACAAIFDRAGAVVTARPMGSLLARKHRALLAAVLDTYKFGLVS